MTELKEQRRDLPKYLKEGDDGSIAVELKKPFELNGSPVDHVRLRCPMVEDEVQVEKQGGDDYQQEINMLSRLAGMNPEDWKKKISSPDHRRAGVAYNAFFG